jgi:adenylate cyclase
MTRASLALALVIGLTAVLWRGLVADPVTGALEDRLRDARILLRGARPAPGAVVLVAIDERTIDRFGWTPPPRAAIAKAIARIEAAGASALGLDLLLIDRTDADATLAAAFDAWPGAVLGSAVVPGPAPQALDPAVRAALARSTVPVALGPAPRTDPPRVLLPTTAFLAQSRLGHVHLRTGSDGMARALPPTLWVGEAGYLPALSVALAQKDAAATALRRTATGGLVIDGRQVADGRNGLLLNPYGGPGSIATVSLADVVDGVVPDSVFADRAVIIGATAESLTDVFATPFAPLVSGAELHATAAENLIAGDLLDTGRAAWAWTAVLALLAPLALARAAALRRPSLAVAAGLATWATAFGLTYVAFAAQALMLDAAALALALGAATGVFVLRRMQGDRRQTMQLSTERANLGRFVPAPLVDDVARNVVPRFDSRTQPACVLFVDAAGFTAMTQDLAPGDTALLMRRIHHHYDACAGAHRGIVTAYEGDGAMMVFGLPDPAGDDAARAMDCARMLLAGGVTSPDGAPVRLRISLHQGLVTAAIVGGGDHAQITVTGDTVNVASRLQDIAKSEGRALVASRAAVLAAGPAAADLTPLVSTPMRGRAGEIEVWALPPGASHP